MTILKDTPKRVVLEVEKDALHRDRDEADVGVRGWMGGKRLCHDAYIIESVDSISRDEPLTQYITNAGISRARYTITLFKHHHRVLRLISN